ncbi:hypothetical protein C8T65DRAFT_714592 [Cerioporus squamosus]|nr:hypothetical protein C8T65DRAFT_714592 [Cerioporus squamosus]
MIGANSHVEFVLRVTQWWRGKDSEGNLMPLHWALTCDTSGTDNGQTSNVYNAAGNIDTFCYEAEMNVPIRHDGWRGSLIVGRIPLASLNQFEHILSQIPTTRHDPSWNCQNWVCLSLRELRQAGFAIDPQLSMHACAWENRDI